MMKKQTMEFVVQTDESGIVKNIGVGVAYHPPIKYDGRKTKWFDDSKLLKKEYVNHSRQNKS